MEDLYFNEAFSQNEDGINLEINNLSVNCIISNNDNFSLDSDGNLIVNSIQTIEEANVDYQSIFNLVYPIGSIYTSVVATNPSILFGGTWASFATGRALVGIDLMQSEFDTAEKIGGNKFTEKHKHQGLYGTYYEGRQFVSRGDSGGGGTNVVYPSSVVTQDGSYSQIETGQFGTGNSGNLQPYIIVYMWKKTA